MKSYQTSQDSLFCHWIMARCHNYQHWLKWPLPWCVGPLCAGSSSENPGCLALQSGSDVKGLWVPPNTLVDNPQQGCHQVVPQREAVPWSHGTPQPTALHPKERKINVVKRLLLVWFMQLVSVGIITEIKVICTFYQSIRCQYWNWII